MRITTNPRQYGIINSDPTTPTFLQEQRAAGAADDETADQLAAVIPGLKDQLVRLRTATKNDPAATTAYLNTRYYGDARYSPQSAAPKGFIARSLDRIYNNLIQDSIDIGQSVEDYATNKQGFGNTLAQVGGNLASVTASPLAMPAEEAVLSAGTYAYQNVPGVKGTVDDVLRTDFMQKGVVPAFQGYEKAKETSPLLRSTEAVAEGAFDFMAANAAYKGVVKPGLKAAAHPGQAVKSLANTAGRAVGATANAAYQPIKSFGSGIKQGFSGTDDVAKAVAGSADDAARAAAGNVDDVAKPLGKKAAEAVSKGIDEPTVRFIGKRNPDEKYLMKAMATEAEKGSRLFGGSTKHKDILGSQLLRPVDHIIEQRQHVGKAIGNMVESMGDETVDLTDTGIRVLEQMKNKGVVFSRDTGKIISIAGAADDEIPVLQKIVNFFQPDDQGRILKSYRDAHLYRQKIFAETNAAKAKLAPTAGGKAVFSVSDTVGSTARSNIRQTLSAMNPNYGKLAGAYDDLINEPAQFFKDLGYKGPLDEISTQSLRTGEVSLRTLGNASARPKESLQKMLAVARKYGYESPIDEMELIKWSDGLEDIFPIAPTRSLRGEVARAGTDVVGNIAKKKGLIRGLATSADEKLMEGLNWVRGMTPENRLRLLNELLDDVDSVDDVVRNATINSADDLAKETQSLAPSMDDALTKGQGAGGSTIYSSKSQAEANLIQAQKDLATWQDTLNTAQSPAGIKHAKQQVKYLTNLVGRTKQEITKFNVSDAQRAMADSADDLSQVSVGQKAEAARAVTNPTVDGGATLAKAQKTIPTFEEAERMITKSGGYKNVSDSSLPSLNAYAASELSEGVGLDKRWMYTEATKRGINLNERLSAFDALRGEGGDTMKFITRLHDELATGFPDLRTGGATLAKAQVMNTIRSAKVGDKITVPIDTSIILPPKGIPPKFWNLDTIAKRLPPKMSEKLAGPIEAVVENGELRLFDGVHRLGEAIRKGAKTVTIRIVD